jgi:dihydropyrimidinase
MEQKRTGLNDFRLIPNGTGGLEDRMPVLWSAGVNMGRLTPNEFVAVTSANSARILNMYPQKGVIMPGADADIVIWDPNATKTIQAKTQVSRIEYNVFEGVELTGLPVRVFLRGRLAAENGKVAAERGQGRFVARRPLPAFAEAQRLWKARTAPQAVAR